MCGISGIVHFDRQKPALAEDIKGMSELLIHRGPHGHGFYVKNNVVLAHQRLGIV